jgi:hypothetical protein
MSDRHVVPVEDGWHVEKEHAQRASAKAPTQAEAIKRAVEIVANDGGGKVVVYGTNGQVREIRTVAAGDEDSAVDAVRTVASATAAGAKATGKNAASEVSHTAGGIIRDAERTGEKIFRQTASAGRKAADTGTGAADEIAGQVSNGKPVRDAVSDSTSVAEKAGREIADQTRTTARRVAGEARKAGGRGLEAVEDLAERGGGAVRDRADRAAVIGGELDEELLSAADRAGRRVHSFTERVARPLDSTTEQVLDGVGRLAHALNPIRFTGRAVEVWVTAALRTTGAITSKAGRTARAAARTR